MHRMGRVPQKKKTVLRRENNAMNFEDFNMLSGCVRISFDSVEK